MAQPPDPNPFADLPPDEKSARQRLEQIIPDVVKRAMYAGLGAVFSTEEGIRKLAGDFHLPKDVASYLLTQAAASKDELLRIVAQELRKFLETVNLSNELSKLLTSLSFEIKTEVRFIPNDEAVGGVKPDIKRQVAVKRGRDDDKAPAAERRDTREGLDERQARHARDEREGRDARAPRADGRDARGDGRARSDRKPE